MKKNSMTTTGCLKTFFARAHKARERRETLKQNRIILFTHFFRLIRARGLNLEVFRRRFVAR